MRMETLALAIALLGACGDEVIVFDDGELADDEITEPIEIEGSTQWGSGQTDPSSCVRCGEGDCGMCAGMYGASHRCEGEYPPSTGCFQLGSLFEDGEAHYVCWSCD